MTPPAKPTAPSAAGAEQSVQAARQQRQQRLWWRTIIGVVIVGGALFAIFRTGTAGHIGGYQVGQPASGATAPPIRLTATDGTAFDLSALHGKTVLLYFQEGVDCQPCWTQLADIEHDQAKFSRLGIDQVVSIAGNPLDALRQKASDLGLHSTILADPVLAVSKTYHTNDFGMMGTSADGHTFIVVGPDGKIRWRADYGGAPNYTMFVPVDHLVADLHAGLSAS